MPVLTLPPASAASPASTTPLKSCFTTSGETCIQLTLGLCITILCQKRVVEVEIYQATFFTLESSLNSKSDPVEAAFEPGARILDRHEKTARMERAVYKKRADIVVEPNHVVRTLIIGSIAS